MLSLPISQPALYTPVLAGVAVTLASVPLRTTLLWSPEVTAVINRGVNGESNSQCSGWWPEQVTVNCFHAGGNADLTGLQGFQCDKYHRPWRTDPHCFPHTPTWRAVPERSNYTVCPSAPEILLLTNRSKSHAHLRRGQVPVPHTILNVHGSCSV